MTLTHTEKRLLLAPRKHRPAIIAHKGGNTAAQAMLAIEDVADYLEVDLWVHKDRFEARHEARVLHRLPVLFDNGRFSLLTRRPFGLADLFAQTEGHIDIFLDLKNGGADAGRLVRKAIDEADYSQRVVASSQLWPVLRGLHDVAPEVDLFYSMGVRAQLDLFLSVSQRDTKPRGVSCRHSLLTKETIQMLHDRGLLVVAWTVDDIDRAEQLAEMGVDGITTHRVLEIRARLAQT